MIKKIQNLIKNKKITNQAGFTHAQAGFTFIELVVVISIFAIMSTVVIFKFQDFSSNVTLQNLSHDIALRVKDAQSKAIFGQSNNKDNFTFGQSYTGEYNSETRFAPTYGVYIDTNFNKEFIIFGDNYGLINDGIYQDLSGCAAPNNTECLEKVTIQGSETISEICANVSSVGSCADLSGIPIIGNLTVTFKRPFPDARIVGNGDTFSPYNSVRIRLSNVNGTQYRYVFISSLGQITAQ